MRPSPREGPTPRFARASVVPLRRRSPGSRISAARPSSQDLVPVTGGRLLPVDSCATAPDFHRIPCRRSAVPAVCHARHPSRRTRGQTTGMITATLPRTALEYELRRSGCAVDARCPETESGDLLGLLGLGEPRSPFALVGGGGREERHPLPVGREFLRMSGEGGGGFHASSFPRHGRSETGSDTARRRYVVGRGSDACREARTREGAAAPGGIEGGCCRRELDAP